MSGAATLSVAGSRRTPRLSEALRAALRRITWRTVAVAVAIGFAFELWSMFEIYRGETHLGPLLGLTTNVAMALSIMVTAFVADEMVARGTRRLRAYAGAVATGTALAALVPWLAHRWLYLIPLAVERGPVPPAVAILGVYFEYLIWGGIAVFIYVNHRTALAEATRMNAAQMRRAQAVRRSLESRLQALQARVEPQFLFNTLARVRDAYNSDPARGAAMLDNLIVYLRASLPRLRDSTSTLAQELDLVRAYWAIMREHPGVRLAITADQAALTSRMPAMVLLPLIDILWREVPPGSVAALEIGARAEAGMLRVEMQGEQCQLATGSDDGLRDIRDRLQALYGGRACVRALAAGSRGGCIVTEIPHEAADSSHR